MLVNSDEELDRSHINKIMNKTRILDLDNIEAPLLIFGGCYSNLQATQAMQNWTEENNFLPAQCICTGDIVAYCANPYETIELIRDWGVHCIQGNVEQSLASQSDDCGCGFEEGTVCDTMSRVWYPFADNAVSNAQKTWLKTLPEHLQFLIANQTIRVVHGAATDVSRFMFASQPNSDFLDEFALLDDNQNTDADVIIAGHSGLPFTKYVNNKQWHNSGVIGMPANDGTQDVWFSVLKINDNELKFSHHRLEYDVESAYQQMLKNNLTQGYHQSLKTGLWPSMDVLPDFEKQQQGSASLDSLGVKEVVE